MSTVNKKYQQEQRRRYLGTSYKDQAARDVEDVTPEELHFIEQCLNYGDPKLAFLEVFGKEDDWDDIQVGQAARSCLSRLPVAKVYASRRLEKANELQLSKELRVLDLQNLIHNLSMQVHRTGRGGKMTIDTRVVEQLLDVMQYQDSVVGIAAVKTDKEFDIKLNFQPFKDVEVTEIEALDHDSET